MSLPRSQDIPLTFDMPLANSSTHVRRPRFCRNQADEPQGTKLGLCELQNRVDKFIHCRESRLTATPLIRSATILDITLETNPA